MLRRTTVNFAGRGFVAVLMSLTTLAMWAVSTMPCSFAQEQDSPGETKRYDAFRPLNSITASITPKLVDEEGSPLPLPENLAQEEMARLGTSHHVFGYSRPWALSAFCWESDRLCRGPLYFEETSLERYGHQVPVVQPVVTAGHFYATLPTLPYRMGAQYPWECLYELGYDRPGNCVPYEWELPPLSLRGGLFAGGIITGLIYALP